MTLYIYSSPSHSALIWFLPWPDVITERLNHRGKRYRYYSFLFSSREVYVFSSGSVVPDREIMFYWVPGFVCWRVNVDFYSLFNRRKSSAAAKPAAPGMIPIANVNHRHHHHYHNNSNSNNSPKDILCTILTSMGMMTFNLFSPLHVHRNIALLNATTIIMNHIPHHQQPH